MLKVEKIKVFKIIKVRIVIYAFIIFNLNYDTHMCFTRSVYKESFYTCDIEDRLSHANVPIRRG